MAYEMVMPYHLHMPSYFLETFTEYPLLNYMLKYKIPQIVTLTQCFDMLIFAMHQKQKIPVKY